MSEAIFRAQVSVRGCDLDSEARLSPTTLLRYFENLRWDAHAAGTSPGARLFDDGHVAVVVAQQMRVQRTVGYRTQLVGEMWLSRVGRTSVTIEHRLLSDGDVIAQCATAAVRLGPDRRPAQVPDSIRSMVLTNEGTVTLEAPPTEVPADASVQPYQVRASEIDFLGHVNQSNYLAYVDDARRRLLGSRERLGAVHVVYAREALENDELAICTWPIAEGVIGGIVRRGDETLCRARLEIGA